MDLLLNATTRAVGRTVPGAPPSDDQRHRFHAPHRLRTRPTLVDGWSSISRANLPARRRLTDCGVASHLPTHRRGGLPRPPGLGLRITLPTPHQPLSHGASRRDSSPCRGAEGWAEVCGVCASVYRDADSYVSLTPVGGGVLDAPRLRDCRAALDAPVRPDQPHPRFPRRVRLAPTTPRIQSRGHSPRTILCGRANVVRRPRPGGRGSPPLRWIG